MPTTSTAGVETAVRRRSFSTAAVRACLLAAFFCVSALYEAWRLSALTNVEVWLHLRTGLWILQSHAVPRSGIFSQYPELSWVDSSWGFDVLLALAYKLVGLRAVSLGLMALKTALAIVTFLLARAARAGLWTAVLLSAVAQYVIGGMQPFPAVCSVVFFGIELVLLMRTRWSGDARSLFWLPPLFLLWANLHIQFVCGLILLAVFVAAVAGEQLVRKSGIAWLDDQIPALPPVTVCLIGVGAFLATLLNPYFLRLIPSAYQTLYSSVGFEHFAEMRSMSFRRPQEFALMLLVMAAFLILGGNRRLRILELALLVAGTAVAFRVQRDGWLAVLPAVAIIAGGFRVRKAGLRSLKAPAARWEKAVVAGIVVLLLGITATFLPQDSALMARVGRNFPVRACDFISQSKLPMPLFNAYSWGDFLAWYLPQYPVAIDSRVELYGDRILSEYFDVTSGKDRLDSDPKLAAARTLLLERQSGMAKALTDLPALSVHYRLVYSDDLAAVFVRQ